MFAWYDMLLFGFALFFIGMFVNSWFDDSQSKVLKRLRQLDAKDADEYIAKLKEEIDDNNEYKAKYEALTAELEDMAKRYPTFNPFKRVVGELKDEEGGV